MLDQVKLLREIQQIGNSLFTDIQPALKLARDAWRALIADPTFVYRVKELPSPWTVPYWQGPIDERTKIAAISAYTVLAVDGSQIYPDKHQGISCSLINIGTFSLQYGETRSHVRSSTTPYVVYDAADGSSSGTSEVVTPEWINGKRQALEFSTGCSCMDALPVSTQVPNLFLFDGSLIFWHLESKDSELKQLFLHQYIQSLQYAAERAYILAGYISLPKAKDLVHLTQLWLKTQGEEESTIQQLDRLVDSNIAAFFLSPGERSIPLLSNSAITALYPEHLRPYFFYVHVGYEIVRIEVPAWIAHLPEMVNHIASVVHDQCEKGEGYPVCLAEAHEQAVIKGPDRDFFYALITKMGVEAQRTVVPSRKSFKKRVMGV